MAPFRIIGAVSDNGISFVTALEFYKLEKNDKTFLGVSLLTYWYINSKSVINHGSGTLDTCYFRGMRVIYRIYDT